MVKVRRILAAFAAHLPSNKLRVGLYRRFPGYRIAKNVSIGFGTVINVDRFECGEGVRIRRGNAFVGPITVILGEGTFIGRWNRFDCGESAADPAQAHKGYRRLFKTGKDCLINESHLFDILGSITVGDGTWIAGFSSQFLTHGAGVMDRDIALGSNGFLGSAVRFAPGSGIGDRVMVGMGAVVTKRIPEDDVVVGGLPAKVIRKREPGDSYEFTKTW